MTLAGTAQAQDTIPCGAGLVCANAPQTVFDALTRTGMKPKLDKDDGGDPMVDGEAAGYMFSVYFYDCTANKQCGAVQFYASFDYISDDPDGVSNKWNKTNRYLKMSADKKDTLIVRFDVNMLGGLNKRNFDDTLTAWEEQLGVLADFFEENPSK